MRALLGTSLAGSSPSRCTTSAASRSRRSTETGPSHSPGTSRVHLRSEDASEIEVGPFDSGRSLSRDHLTARVDEGLIAGEWAVMTGEGGKGEADARAALRSLPLSRHPTRR